MRSLLRITSLAFLLVSGAMAMPPWFFLSGNKPASITVPLAWGENDCSGSSSCDATSVGSQTLTVPTGSSGVVKFNIVGSNACSYSTNNGSSYTVFSDNQTVAFTNGQTLKLKIAALTPAVCGQILITDNVTGDYVGGSTGYTGCNGFDVSGGGGG